MPSDPHAGTGVLRDFFDRHLQSDHYRAVAGLPLLPGAKETAPPHEHRRPEPRDFVGKTVARFEADADNVWRVWFTDGTAFAIQAETNSAGIAYMELCDACAER